MRDPYLYEDTKVFLPWGKSLHPDHRATYEIRQINLLNQFRASQLHEHTDCKCIEAFDKVEIFV